MQLKSIPLAFVILVVFFGGIGASGALNYWQTESSKIPEKFLTGEVAGEYNPADIRGSYTFGYTHFVQYSPGRYSYGISIATKC